MTTIERIEQVLGLHSFTRRLNGAVTWPKRAFRRLDWALRLEIEAKQLESTLADRFQLILLLLLLDSRECLGLINQRTIETSEIAQGANRRLDELESCLSDKFAALDTLSPMTAQLKGLSLNQSKLISEISAAVAESKFHAADVRHSINSLARPQHSSNSRAPDTIWSTSPQIRLRNVPGQRLQHGSLIAHDVQLAPPDATLLYRLLNALGEDHIRVAIVLTFTLSAIQRFLAPF